MTMAISMTKTERIQAALAGKQPDTIPYTMWTHFPDDDLDPVANAEKTYDFFKQYDIDILKTMNNGMYSVEDFGCEVDFSEISRGGVARIVRTPVQDAADWKNIKPANILEGALGRELRYLSLLLEKMKDEAAPVLFTVFSPLTTANKLSGSRMLEHIQEGHGDEVRRALDVITQTTCQLVEKAIELGASGIYLATQMSSYDIMSEAMYREYGMPFDLEVLNASSGWCNVVHAHGTNPMFNLLKDYPSHVFNWHAYETLPDVEEAALLTGKCLMGGIYRMDITKGDRNAVRNQIFRTVKTLRGRSLILSPSCVIRHPLDDDMLGFIRKVKQDIEEVLVSHTY
ncbi:MAG: Uroporphyrinogen-III decarboxylase [Paenibacillaceae bacterium]|jgi:uroporphyrinogen decarboxylase|nr:Uroporphyrinogen-III decarboxylase [Paenibacillaceae bacterium]